MSAVMKVANVFRKFNGVSHIDELINELRYCHLFHDTVKVGGWFDVDKESYSLGNSAVGYNYYYVVYRILDEMNPKNIIEMGLGQSTNLLSAYARTHLDSMHITVEHDVEWVNFYNKKYEMQNHNSRIEMVDLHAEKQSFKDGWTYYKYDTTQFFNIVNEKKYDFISIDAPFGEIGKSVYNRVDILEYLPDCLDNDFVIIIDDYGRKGEKNTVLEIQNILNRSNIKHSIGIYRGQTDICCIASENWKWFCTM